MAPDVSQGLSADSLLRQARELVASVGVDGLTVRGLARHAGVYPTAVTYHLGGLDDIRRAVADAVVSSVEIEPLSEPGDWQQWLRRLAERCYDEMAAAPGVYRFVARVGPTSPSQMALIDACVQVLSGAGLSDRDATHAYGAYINLIGGAADVAATLALFADQRPERQAEFRTHIESAALLHPGLARTIPSFAEWDHKEAFLFALDLLLDGVSARV